MALNDHRMPGFGDLAGDSSHPNSPDYREPMYGEDDAEGDVANKLIESGDVAELVSDVRGALAALDWACAQTNVPRHLQQSFRSITARAKLLNRMVEAQVGVMS